MFITFNSHHIILLIVIENKISVQFLRSWIRIWIADLGDYNHADPPNWYGMSTKTWTVVVQQANMVLGWEIKKKKKIAGVQATSKNSYSEIWNCYLELKITTTDIWLLELVMGLKRDCPAGRTWLIVVLIDRSLEGRGAVNFSRLYPSSLIWEAL